MKYTFVEGKALAFQYTKKKIENHKLFKSDDETPVANDFVNGDPETLYSIASLYGEFIQGDVYENETKLLEALQEKYPQFK